MSLASADAATPSKSFCSTVLTYLLFTSLFRHDASVFSDDVSFLGHDTSVFSDEALICRFALGLRHTLLKHAYAQHALLALYLALGFLKQYDYLLRQ